MSAQALLRSTCLATALVAVPALAQDYSTSIVRPTALKEAGVVAGTLPGTQGAKSYYLAVDLRPGMLMSQIKVTASSSAARSVTLDLLDSDATRRDSYYVKTSRNDQNEASRGFQIDANGTYNLRVTVEGPEAGRFCVLLGGSALPNVKAAECPADPATVVAQAQRVEAVRPPRPRRGLRSRRLRRSRLRRRRRPSRSSRPDASSACASARSSCSTSTSRRSGRRRDPPSSTSRRPCSAPESRS